MRSGLGRRYCFIQRGKKFRVLFVAMVRVFQPFFRNEGAPRSQGKNAKLIRGELIQLCFYLSKTHKVNSIVSSCQLKRILLATNEHGSQRSEVRSHRSTLFNTTPKIFAPTPSNS